MLFLQERVYRFNAQAVINNLDSKLGFVAACSKYYSCDFGAFTLELLSLLDCVWEVSQNVLSITFDAREDYFLEHLDN